MSRNNQIIVSANPHENLFVEGIIATGETPKPGQVVQRDLTVALSGGRHTWKIYAPGTDGQIVDYCLLLEDALQGKLMTTAYAAGDRFLGYRPYAGLEFNGLLANVSGTATITAGTRLILDTSTGKFIATTGSPEEICVAILLEDVVDNAADQLAWMEWTGN